MTSHSSKEPWCLSPEYVVSIIACADMQNQPNDSAIEEKEKEFSEIYFLQYVWMNCSHEDVQLGSSFAPCLG